MSIKEFIEAKTEYINTIGITGPISEDTLLEICEEYFKLRFEVFKKDLENLK